MERFCFAGQVDNYVKQEERTHCMTHFLQVHILILPRWFASPIVIAGVTLGILLQGEWSAMVIASFLGGLLLMAFGHSWNSFHDYVITGLDKGEQLERSMEKPYTSGQSVIPSGRASPRGVLFNALFYLILSTIPFAVLSIHSTPYVWGIWVFVTLCAPWYSEAKLRWHPELPLALGFGPGAVWVGMAASGEVAWMTGFLASIPFALLFGVVAEYVDQAIDAEANWKKGARSLGMLVALSRIPLWVPLSLLLALVYISQLVLVVFNMLPPTSLLSLLALALFIVFLEQYRRGIKKETIMEIIVTLARASMVGLVGIVTYMFLFLLGVWWALFL